MDPNENRKIATLQIRKFTLKYDDEDMEYIFRKESLKKLVSGLRIIIFIFWFSEILTSILILNMVPEAETDFFIWTRIITIVIFSVVMIFVFLEYIKKYYDEVIPTLMILIVAIKIIYEWGENSDISIYSLMIAAFLSQIMIFYPFKVILLLISAISTCIRLPTSNSHSQFYPVAIGIGYQIFITIYMLSVAYHVNNSIIQHEIAQKKEFLSRNKVKDQTKKLTETLSLLLPKFIKDRIDQGHKFISENQGEVVIIFCDICNFNGMINEMGTSLVKLLDNLFRVFDGYCIRNGVQKIETVGKTYMACVGLPECENQFSTELRMLEITRRAINFAFKANDFARSQRYGEEDKPIVLKIGIHYGRVIAGVIGYHKPQFSLIGDTVNTASRVCSTGLDGHIMLSEEAYQRLKHSEIKWAKRVINAKGKGDMNTYIAFNSIRQYKSYMKKYHSIAEAIMQTTQNELIRREERKSMINISNNEMSIDLNSPMEEKNQNNLGSQRNSVGNKMSLKVGRIIKDKIIKPKKAQAQIDPSNPLSKFRKLLYIKEVKKDLEVPKINIIESIEEKSPINVEGHREVLNDLENSSNEHAISLSKYFIGKILLLVRSKDYRGKMAIKEMLDLHYNNNKKSDSVNLSIYLIFYIVKILIALSVDDYFNNYFIVLCYRIIVFTILCGYIFGQELMHKKNVLRVSIIIMYLLTIITCFVNSNEYMKNDYLYSDATEIILSCIVFTNLSYIQFIDIFLPTFFLFIVWVGVFASKNIEMGTGIVIPLFFCLFYILCQYNQIQRTRINDYNTMQIMDKKKKQEKNLLNNLLPKHYLDIFLGNPKKKIDLIDTISEASILFADISGFTAYSSSVQPEDVVRMLKEMFTDFDKLCLLHKVYKVYTIGDCYVVLGHTDKGSRNPALEAINTIEMGFSMIEVIANVRAKINFAGLQMRIGIHTV